MFLKITQWIANDRQLGRPGVGAHACNPSTRRVKKTKVATNLKSALVQPDNPPAKKRTPDSGSVLEMGRQSLSHESLGVNIDTAEVFQCLGDGR